MDLQFIQCYFHAQFLFVTTASCAIFPIVVRTTVFSVATSRLQYKAFMAVLPLPLSYCFLPELLLSIYSHIYILKNFSFIFPAFIVNQQSLEYLSAYTHKPEPGCKSMYNVKCSYSYYMCTPAYNYIFKRIPRKFFHIFH